MHFLSIFRLNLINLFFGQPWCRGRVVVPLTEGSQVRFPPCPPIGVLGQGSEPHFAHGGYMLASLLGNRVYVNVYLTSRPFGSRYNHDISKYYLSKNINIT